MFVFYRQIGEFMSIRDIPDTLEELTDWADVSAVFRVFDEANRHLQNYELHHMIPDKSNSELVQGMLDELVLGVPSFAKRFVQSFLICIFDERMRIAMMYALIYILTDTNASC